jgi:hypothetical protein
VCGIMLLLLHLMVLPLIAAIALQLLFMENKSLWHHRRSVAVIVVVSLVVSWPYLLHLFHEFESPISGGGVAWRGLLFPFLGAHHLALAGLANAFGDTWLNQLPVAAGEMFLVARWISLLAYPLVWSGMILAIPRCWRAIRHPREALPLARFFVVVWAALILQCIMDGLMHIYEGPHYYNATWMLHVAFAFLAVGWLWQHGGSKSFLFRILLPAYAASLLFSLTILAITIRRDGGILSVNFGTSLAQQMAAVTGIQMYSDDSPRLITIGQWNEHPQALEALERLLIPPVGPRPRRYLVIEYRKEFPGDARIAVIAH